MTLVELLNNVETIKIIGNKNLQIEDVVINSSSVTKNSLYICEIKANTY